MAWQAGQAFNATEMRTDKTRGFSQKRRKATAVVEFSFRSAWQFGQHKALSAVCVWQIEQVCTHLLQSVFMILLRSV
jgi:hypothetical protein